MWRDRGKCIFIVYGRLEKVQRTKIHRYCNNHDRKMKKFLGLRALNYFTWITNIESNGGINGGKHR